MKKILFYLLLSNISTSIICSQYPTFFKGSNYFKPTSSITQYQNHRLSNSSIKTEDFFDVIRFNRFNKFELVKDYILKGANPNAKNSSNTTALMVASANGNVPVTELLLKAGANPNAQDHNGNTTLMQAAGIGNMEMVSLLLASGANIDAQDHDGNTALMQAALFGDMEMVELLLKSGANIDAQDYDGRTALMQAAGFGDMEMVELLLKAGANPLLSSNNNETALTLTDTPAIRKLILDKIMANTLEDINL